MLKFFYYCFILDITCSLVPDIERVSIWFRLDSMSIFVSIVKQTISFYNNHVFSLFPWQPIPVIFHNFVYAISLILFKCMHITL